MIFDFSGNREAKYVQQIVNYNTDNIFLTGKAGTGKTTLLKTIVAGLKKKYVVLAPTGMTALNANGRTIHSFFQFGFAPIPPNQPINFEYKEDKRAIINALDIIVIDEVSMVRADLIDAIDRTLRYYRRNTLPFGGIQLLLIGDSFQLPPIVTSMDWLILKNHYQSTFFFDADVFRQSNLLTVELLKVYRQQEETFLNLLNAIRLNKVNAEHLALLNERVITSKVRKPDLTLATENSIVYQINSSALSKLSGPSTTYTGIIQGVFKTNTLPTDEHLILKNGSKVMFIKNDFNNRWVNGTFGTVIHMGKNEVTIQLPSGLYERVEPVTWYNNEYTYDNATKTVVTKEIGRITQLPLTLSWATTIHKSQGLTFDEVLIDLGRGTWESGQTYVALSRCKTFEGLYLTRPLTLEDIVLDNAILEFANGFNNIEVYKSVLKAKNVNKSLLLAEIESFKQESRHEEIIEAYDELLTLSNNLLEKFHFLIQQGYCAYRACNNDLATHIEKEIEKYAPLRKMIGTSEYDSCSILLHSLKLMNSAETRSRGYQKLDMLFTHSHPDTIDYLSMIAFDKEDIKA
jgi:energy-coupling factor transporter ATP-binding protein EcfA2